jgi:hypothetical protein
MSICFKIVPTLIVAVKSLVREMGLLDEVAQASLGNPRARAVRNDSGRVERRCIVA